MTGLTHTHMHLANGWLMDAFRLLACSLLSCVCVCVRGRVVVLVLICCIRRNRRFT